MSRHPSPSSPRLEPATRSTLHLVGKPRDAKRHNAAYDDGHSARRSLTQELQADRKR